MPRLSLDGLVLARQRPSADQGLGRRLGTRSLTDTVDAALDEVIRLRERAQLVEILFKPGALELDDPTAMAGAWR
jgi:hypothetical protein